MNETQTAAPARSGSALATLKALSGKKPAPPGSVAGEQAADPALAGAKRNKNTVTLGFDPAIAEDALSCAQLKKALEDAATEFAAVQARMRDYGRGKRESYNGLFKANVTTVEVPYLAGKETKVVQVICSNKYSVAKDTVLNVKEDLGESYDRLFKEERVKALKPNAEQLLVDLLGELGLSEEDRANAMKVLFEERVSVTTTEAYEAEVKKVPAPMQKILSQAVTRSAPSLKFPALD